MTRTTLTPEIKQQIRRIQLYTNRMVRALCQGEQQSRKRGPGFLFDQLRDYYMGDDIRFIDWKSSARMNSLLIKQYQEERSKHIVIVVDISSSQLFGHAEHDKRDCINTVATIFAWVAQLGHDQVGLILFSDQVEYYIPCKSGSTHVQRIIHELFAWGKKGTGTRLQTVFDFLPKHYPRDAMVIMISDFIDDGLNHRALKKIGALYDVIAVRCLDQYECDLPPIGFLMLEDLETGAQCMIDTRKKTAQAFKRLLEQRMQEQELVFKRSGFTVIDLQPSQSYTSRLIRFFYKRMNY